MGNLCDVTAKSPLVVAAAQPRLVDGDLDANVATHADVVRRTCARLVVFPELSLTGYDLDADSVDPADERLAPLVAACAAADSYALVGAPIDFRGAHRIGALLVSAEGVTPIYAKMCLGGGENDYFVAGDQPTVFVVDGWRVGVGLCKDTRILEHLRAVRAEGIDVYAAGLVHTPDEEHEFGQRARRITDKMHVPVVFAGYAGPTGPFDETSGGSGVWDADGAVVARAGARPGEVIRALLEPPATRP